MEECDCKNKIMDYENYFQYCSYCGKIFDICPTTVFNDFHLYKQDGNIKKPTNFNQSLHFRQWMLLILGERTPVFIPHKVINKCRDNILSFPLSAGDCIKREINSIRKTLKNIKRSDLNKYTTFIWSMTSGKSPPSVSGDILHKSELIFLDVLNALKKLSNNKKIYYPYFIYKIWDLLLPPENRKILSFIHLQSNKVIKKNENTWRKICKETGLTFRPTA